jgi:anti-sigma regulatory factor (Ser/Thr protein kinase)
VHTSSTVGRFDAQLPAELSSVVASRRLVEAAASAWGIPDGAAADAALAVSELVTNAVLHAGTPISLTIRRLGTGLRLEVADGNAHMPMVEPDEPDDPLATRSMTGRGLAVVAATADRWGADPGDGNGSAKTIWAEVGTGQRRVDAAPVPLYPPEPPPFEVDLVAAAAGVTTLTAVARQGRRVQLVGVPVQLLVESVRQLADFQREMQVIGLDHNGPSELAELADSSRELAFEIGAFNHTGMPQAQAAMARGESVVDFEITLPDDAEALIDRLGSLLRKVTPAIVKRHLLSLPPSQEVAAFRTWYHDEVMAQLGGRPPQPCPLVSTEARPA